MTDPSLYVAYGGGLIPVCMLHTGGTDPSLHVAYGKD